MKELPIEERPREKMILKGKEFLSNKELISIILKTGTKKLSVNDISLMIIDKYDMNELKDISINDLIKIDGIGKIKAITLIAAIELGKRIYMMEPTMYMKLCTPEEIFINTKYLFNGLKQEHFYCLYFNSKQELIGKKLLFIGTVNNSVTHPREVFREAYRLSAYSIVCIHNHPSNDITPSKEDIVFTNSLVKVGKIQGIPLIDHIIIGDSKYYSFYENNMFK